MKKNFVAAWKALINPQTHTSRYDDLITSTDQEAIDRMASYQLPVLKTPGLVEQMVKASLADPAHIIKSIELHSIDNQRDILSTKGVIKGLAYDNPTAVIKLYDRQNVPAKAKILLSDTSSNGPFCSMAQGTSNYSVLKRFNEQSPDVRKALLLGAPIADLTSSSDESAFGKSFTNDAIAFANSNMTFDEQRDFFLVNRNLRNMAYANPDAAIQMIKQQPSVDSQWAMLSKPGDDITLYLAYVGGKAEALVELLQKQPAERQSEFLKTGQNSLRMGRYLPNRVYYSPAYQMLGHTAQPA